MVHYLNLSSNIVLLCIVEITKILMQLIVISIDTLNYTKKLESQINFLSIL